MPAQWFFVPYVRRDSPSGRPGRYCNMDDFTGDILGDGGKWAEFECGGGPGSVFELGVAGVKVGGVTQATLNLILAAPGLRPIPVKWLEPGTSLSIATTGERTFLRDTLRQDMGYTVAELDGWLGLSGSPTNAQRNTALNTKTFVQLLDFLATRWYTPVYDPAGWQLANGNIVAQGTPGALPGVLSCSNVSSVPVSPTPTTPAQVAAAVPST